MRLPTRVLVERQSRAGPAASASSSSTPPATPPPPSSPTQGALFAGIAVGLVLLAAAIFLFFRIKRLRAKNAEPKYVPGKYLKRQWQAWKPWSAYATVGKPSDTPLTASHTTCAPASAPVPTATAADEIDRRQSVRSVITLPSYHFKPHADEQLIAREGERAGIDMVIELPESEQLSEERREAEMAALYNIRQARRREAAQRETRRLERQQARARGDWDRLRVMEEESRARARLRAQSEAVLLRATTGGAASATGARVEDLDLTGLTPDDSAYLIAELAAQREGGARARVVSSVSYADLGLAWHDGSRIRANSVDSDRPLLASAASMANSRAASRASSVSAQGGAGPEEALASHRRLNSNASFLSSDSAAMNTPQTSSPPDTRNGSRSDFHHPLTPSSTHELAPDPPSYDDDVSVHGGGDAPPYESPVRERGPGLPGGAMVGGDQAAVTDGPAAQARMEPAAAAAAPAAVTGTPTTASRAKSEDTTTASRDGSESTPTASHERSPVPARLVLSSVPHLPAIEVLSATPISSTPPTPTFDRWRG